MTATTYSGGCHCGAVRYDVTVDLEGAISCNCSRCSKLGAVLTFAPAASFSLRSGEDRLIDYQFNKKTIHHLFCGICGIESFAHGSSPKTGEMVAVNIRCLDGVDAGALSPKPVDERSF